MYNLKISSNKNPKIWNEFIFVDPERCSPDPDPTFQVVPDPGGQTKCGSRRFRILVRLCRHKSLIFTCKHPLYVGNKSQKISTYVQKSFWKARNQVYSLILVNFLGSPDPDPGEPNHTDPDPQHCFRLTCCERKPPTTGWKRDSLVSRGSSSRCM